MKVIDTKQEYRRITIPVPAYFIAIAICACCFLASGWTAQMASNFVRPEVDLTRPSIGEPRISPRNADGTVDITVDVASVTEDVSIDASDRTKKKTLTSGVYDLRLFRDGQLIGSSAPREAIEKYIAGAPAAVEKDHISKVLLNTEEDKLWREANDMAKVVKFDAEGRASYTFHNIKVPHDGRTEIEFSAYAFNSDRVKSETVRTTYKFEKTAPRTGKAYLISIGVNISENPQYNLQYAANDARNMQSIIGERLRAEAGKYADIIQVPLISDAAKADLPAVNDAQKAIIKGVFSLLAGNESDVPADVLTQIPNREKIKPVEPEDTLIITYAGHGYADQAGIFYLLPYDIGKDTKELTPAVLQKMISSDELSLWMQPVTASEMILIIDACHSSAAVQGDGFKPGPMGSRGLGQLSYDKGMKILSATQADNVALELNSLQQGLLSYALLQDGIKSGLADENHDKKLSTVEWLSYAEKRVPDLYQDIKDGKRGVIIDGREIKDAKGRAEIVGKKKSSIDLQKPKMFNFRNRNAAGTLFTLP